MQNVRIHPEIASPVVPSIGSAVGSVANRQLLDALGDSWGGSVQFGTPNDPHKNLYTTWLSGVVKPFEQGGHRLQTAATVWRTHSDIRPIVSENDLIDVPPSMYVPLLTSPELRPLFEQDKIWGWGVDPVDLPHEDVCGRLIDNGTLYNLCHKAEGDLFFEYEWKGDDPDYSFDELDDIHASRRWVAKWLAEQMEKETGALDPTDFPGGTVGEIKE